MKYYLLILTFLSSLHARPQTGKLYTADHQLSNSFVSQVFQDRDGFIWITTRNGLNRYDGYRFKTYKKEDRRSGLTSNYLNCMFQDRDGNFFIGSNLTVQRYNGEGFDSLRLIGPKGTSIHTYINDIQQRRNGEVLICTSGYGLMRLGADNTARTISRLPADLLYLRRIMEDRQQRLWAVTSHGGLYCLNGGKVTGHYFSDQTMRHSLRDICTDRQGNIWVGTFGQGLWRLNAHTGQFERAATAGRLPIAKLYADRTNRLMLGCDGTGVYIYEPHNGRLTANPYYSRDTQLDHAKVYSITEDRNGNTWLGMLQKGVFMQPAAKSGFGYMGPRLGPANVIGNNCVTSVFTDSRRYLWVGTDKDGLYLLDAQHRLVRHYTTVPGTILSIAEDHLGRIWLGSYEEGCGWVTADNDAYHACKLGVNGPLSVFSIAADRRGRLWMGTMGQGLMCLDPVTQKRVDYRMKAGAETDRRMNSLANDYVGKIAVSRDGHRIYVATSVGIGCLDLEKGSWLSVFGSNCPNYGTFSRVVREGRDGKVYLGTNDGLFVYDTRRHTCRVFTTADGLPDNGVAGVETDNRGNVWIATDHGLGCLNLATGRVACFYVDKGLQSNEFADGASCLSSDGRQLLFGGTGGLTWFDPAHIRPQKWKATVKITGLTVGSNEVSVRPDSDRFDMDYEDNSFSIHLSTLTYDDPDNIVYLYSINGDKWTRLSPGSNEIAFSHLSPGTYRFRVKAILNNAPSEEKTFTVVVAAPWYRSTPAYCVYLLLLAVLVWLYLQYRRRKEEDRLRLQEHIHAEELGEAKLRFFMNISHEIRTPMTLIVSPLQQLIKEDTDAHRRSVYETIRRNAERILSLINQMMDLRKIDKGQMGLQMRETDLVAFIRDIYTLFLHQTKTRNINLRFSHDAETLPVWIDRGNFDKVLMNLLSNAFKFCNAGGNIDIRLSHDDTQARIAVSDDGATIPEDKLERIFERFYQMPSETNDRNIGTGIGLDLTRSLVELHYGSIEARNLPDGRGCEFVVTIPLGNAHLKPEEMAEQAVEARDNEAEQPLPGSPGPEETPDPNALNDRLSNRKRQHIIVAEDDDEIAQYLKAELEKDFRVTLCPNGQEALNTVFKEMPSLVVSDIMMPVMDGNTLCARLKSNVNTNHIPVILLTAKSRDEDRLEGLETGADAYIVKPFNMDILHRTITNLLHQRELLRNKFNGSETQEGKVLHVKVESPDDKLMERIMAVINKNLSNPDLSIDMISTEAGISRVHLHRKMKELTNQTPHAFIRNIRLRQAARLLQTPNQNITEVLVACGFPNATSFSTIFKNFYGMSPRDYMKRGGQQQKEE